MRPPGTFANTLSHLINQCGRFSSSDILQAQRVRLAPMGEFSAFVANFVRTGKGARLRSGPQAPECAACLDIAQCKQRLLQSDEHLHPIEPMTGEMSVETAQCGLELVGRVSVLTRAGTLVVLHMSKLISERTYVRCYGAGGGGCIPFDRARKHTPLIPRFVPHRLISERTYVRCYDSGVALHTTRSRTKTHAFIRVHSPEQRPGSFRRVCANLA
jgi:hypothetical protein